MQLPGHGDRRPYSRDFTKPATIARSGIEVGTFEADETGARLVLCGAHDTAIVPLPGKVERPGSTTVTGEDAIRLLAPTPAHSVRYIHCGSELRAAVIEPGSWKFLDPAQVVETQTPVEQTGTTVAPEATLAVEPEITEAPAETEAAEAASIPTAAAPAAIVVDALLFKKAVAAIHFNVGYSASLDAYRIEATPAGLTLTGADGEVVGSVTVPALEAASAAWSAVVSGRKQLRDFAKGLKKGMRLSLKLEGGVIELVSDITSVTVRTDQKHELPTHREIGAAATTFRSEKLPEALAFASPAIGGSDLSSAVQHARIRGSEVVATDGCRLHRVTLDVELPEMEVSAAAARFITGMGAVEIAVGTEIVVIEDGNRRISFAAAAPPYPDYQRIFRNVRGTKSFHLPLTAEARKAIMETVKALPLPKKQRALSIVANGRLELIAGLDAAGTAKAVLPYALSEAGKEVGFKVNGKFLADVLKMPVSELQIDPSGNTPLLAEGPGIKALLMPLVR